MEVILDPLLLSRREIKGAKTQTTKSEAKRSAYAGHKHVSDNMYWLYRIVLKPMIIMVEAIIWENEHVTPKYAFRYKIGIGSE